MKTSITQFISKTERMYLTLFAFFISAASLANIATVVLHAKYDPPPFEIYDMSRASAIPMGRLLALFLPPFIFWGKRYFAAVVYTLLVLLPFAYELGQAYYFFFHNSDSLREFSFLEVLFMIANPIDYLTFFLANILFIWLCSAVVRSFTYTSKGAA